LKIQKVWHNNLQNEIFLFVLSPAASPECQSPNPCGVIFEQTLAKELVLCSVVKLFSTTRRGTSQPQQHSHAWIDGSYSGQPVASVILKQQQKRFPFLLLEKMDLLQSDQLTNGMARH
jgi:hypothetical protein